MMALTTAGRRVIVSYRVWGQFTRWVHDIKWTDEKMLSTDPDKKIEWENKVKTFAAKTGVDDAAAHTAIMTDPHSGTKSNPKEPMHSTVAFEDRDGKRLVFDGKTITGEPMVHSKTHVYDDEELWPGKERVYRLETETEEAARLARAANIAMKKAAKKAEVAKAKAEGKKTPGFDE